MRLFCLLYKPMYKLFREKNKRLIENSMYLLNKMSAGDRNRTIRHQIKPLRKEGCAISDTNCTTFVQLFTPSYSLFLYPL